VGGLRGAMSKNELAFNRLFAVVGSGMRMPMCVTRAQLGFRSWGWWRSLAFGLGRPWSTGQRPLRAQPPIQR